MDRATHNAMAQMLADNRAGIRAVIEELRGARGEQTGLLYPYWYTFGEGGLAWHNLAASATEFTEFVVSAGSDFYWTAMTGTAVDQSAEGTDQHELLVGFTVQGSDIVLMNEPAHWENLFGLGRTIFELPQPLEIVGGSTLRVEWRNRTATATRIYATLWGFKHKPYGARSATNR